MDSPTVAPDRLEPCPTCGSTPHVISGLFGGYYVACEHGHHETKVVPTRAEAVALWNHRQYEQ